MSRPDGGMYGFKRVTAEHLTYLAPYTQVFNGEGGRVSLMNFRTEGKSLSAAAGIPVGHRALVYCAAHLIWAVEIIGRIDHDHRLLVPHGLTVNDLHPDWLTNRPIRFLARIETPGGDFSRGLSHDRVRELTGFERYRSQAGHFYLTRDEYSSIFDAVPWDWKAS